MTIQSIYFGTLSVSRLYRGGKIIWESEVPVPMAAFVVIASDGEGRMSVLPLIPITGAMGADTDGDGIMHVLPLLPMAARGESDSTAETTFRLFPAASCESDADSVIRFVGDGRYLAAILLNSDTETNSRVTGEGYAFDIVLGEGEASEESFFAGTAQIFPSERSGGETSSFSDSFSRADAAKRLATGSDEYSYSYGLANGGAYEALLVDAISVSVSDGDGYVRLCEAMTSRGFALNETAGSAMLTVIEICRMISTARSTAKGDGDLLAALADVIECGSETLSALRGGALSPPAALSEGNGYDFSQLSAVIALWYLPIQRGDTLFIRQVYDASVNDGVLSIT